MGLHGPNNNFQQQQNNLKVSYTWKLILEQYIRSTSYFVCGGTNDDEGMSANREDVTNKRQKRQLLHYETKMTNKHEHYK